MKRIEAIFLVPSLLVLVVLIVVPFLFILRTSMTNKDTYDFENRKTAFVGFENYSRIVADPRFWNALRVTFTVAMATVFFQMLIGLGLALLMWRTSSNLQFMRGLLLFPMVLPPVVVGLLWKMFLQPILPGLNLILGFFGAGGIDWFGNAFTANAAVVMAVTWQWVPYVFLMLLAGLESLPESCYESARMDGASSIRVFFSITMPLLKRIFVFVLIYRFVETLKIFPIIYSLTGGGPGYATEPISYYIWQEAFNAYRMGYSSAAVVITLGIIAAAVGVMIGYGRKAGVFR